MTDTQPPSTCTWCRRGNRHVEADHPLPADHPDYDAFYDATDDQLGAMVPEWPGA